MRPPSENRPGSETRAHTQAFTPFEAAADTAFSIGNVVADRYRIESFVAAGGMGRVYRAHDLKLDVPLALKTIRPEIAANPGSLRRFKQEVLLARSISHPHVCRIFELGYDRASGAMFLTMEYLPGETLADRIDSGGAIDEDSVLRLARQMAEALDAAHRAGIVHRDFKSPNVMLVPDGDGDRAVITDFGLAVSVGEEEDGGEDAEAEGSGEGQATEREKREEGAEGAGNAGRAAGAVDQGSTSIDPDVDLETIDLRRSRVGGFVGTPAYMSPEQVRGDVAGPASDLYALGVVLFEMCTGRLPFRGDDVMEVARQRLEEDPPSPRLFAPVSSSWDEVIRRLLARHPQERFATAHEAVLALEGRRDDGRPKLYSLPAERDAFVGRRDELAMLGTCLKGRAADAAPDAPPDAAPDAASHAASGATVGSVSAPAAASDPLDGIVKNSISTRLVTLHGTGGTGKTRLAQKYGWDSLLRWPGGVWFCDLSDVRDQLGLVSALAAALRQPLDAGDPVRGLGSALAGLGDALVILDNFEQVVAHAASTVGAWIEQAPGVRFLVTSRERLRLPEEVTIPLEPLDPATRGVELFEARAWGHRPGFLVDPSNQQQIREIVEQLDGLPLAIELAASRLRLLDAEQLRTGLADRFGLLAGGKRGRHETLEATLDWSWDLLEGWEQAAMSQASVFEGGFSLDAAEGVIELPESEDVPALLDILQSLVDKSWLRPSAVDGLPRFRMYATSQEYASQRATAVDSTRHRHLRQFASLAKTAEPELEGRGAERWFHRLAAEDANLRAAIRFGTAVHGAVVDRTADDETAGDETAGDGAVFDDKAVAGRDAGAADDASELCEAMRLACALVRYWQRRGRYAEALALFERGVQRKGELPPLLRARALNGASVMAFRSSDYETAERYGDEAGRLFEIEGDTSGYGTSQLNLGNLAMSTSDLAKARVRFEAASAAYRTTNDRWRLSHAEQNLGALGFYTSDYDVAASHYQTALELARELEDRDQCAVLLMSLGLVELRRGHLETADAQMSECLAEMRAVRNEWGIAVACLNLCAIKQAKDDHAGALPHLRESLERSTGLGDQQITIGALESAASLAAHWGDDARAVRLFGFADRRRAEIRLPRVEPEASEVEGLTAELRGQLGDAFDREQGRGRTMTLEEAIAEGLGIKEGDVESGA